MKEIRNIIELYEAIDWQTEKAALATVVRVEESAYRRIGARMFVKSSGDWIGGVSGGCLEGDALKRAQKAIYNESQSIVVYDTMDDDAHQIGVGLGCNGRIEILFAPIDPSDPNNPVERLKRIQESRTPSIFYQVLQSSDETELGTLREKAECQEFAELIGIDKAELEEQTELVEHRKKPKVVSLKKPDDSQVEVLIEFIRPELKIIIVGDNYDVNAFVGIAHELGWQITVIGLQRKLNKTVYEYAHQVYTYKDAHKIEVDAYTALVLMSHDYHKDKIMLELFYEKKPPYIGMLGPKKRMLKLHHEFEEASVDIDLIHTPSVFSPTGLDIGAESPEEIALSVAAEIIAHFRERDGQPLRLRKSTIHERE